MVRWTVGVTKWREGLRKQHGVLFSPERDRAAARPPVPTIIVAVLLAKWL